jgi:uncharacterized damage-inducible protein DinB
MALPWFERNLTFGHPTVMLPFFLERQHGTSIRLAEKVKGIDDKTLTYKPNGKWSIKEVIGHLAEVDEISIKRIDEILSGATTLSPAVFEPSDYNAKSIEEILSLFQTTRQAKVKILESLGKEELTRSAIHPRLKVAMTLVDLAWFDAEHDDHHLVQINGILAVLRNKNHH